MSKWKVQARGGRRHIYVLEDNPLEQHIASVPVNNYVAKTPERHRAEAIEKAKLIAAAPDLLEACKMMQKLAVHASNDDKITLSGQLSGVWLMAEDAIAKVEVV